MRNSERLFTNALIAAELEAVFLLNSCASCLTSIISYLHRYRQCDILAAILCISNLTSAHLYPPHHASVRMVNLYKLWDAAVTRTSVKTAAVTAAADDDDDGESLCNVIGPHLEHLLLINMGQSSKTTLVFQLRSSSSSSSSSCFLAAGMSHAADGCFITVNILQAHDKKLSYRRDSAAECWAIEIQVAPCFSI